MPGQGVGVERVKRGQKAPKLPKYKNGTNNRWFATFIDLKMVENIEKYLIKYSCKMLF
jgi:hypothetical protein